MWKWLILGVLAGSPAWSETVDLELVLGVDTSRSMDFDELVLQREGYAAALEHPAMIGAIRSGRIAITYFDWGGADRHDVILPWTILSTEADARRAADILRRAPVKNLSGTGIAGAIRKGIALIEGNEIASTRRVIDISGDGPNNTSGPVEEARDAAEAAGIEVNGLPIMIKRPFGAYNIDDLDIYYEDCVITGDSAFVLPVFQPEKLIEAILQKIVLEIAGVRPPKRAKLRKAADTDCLIGEKLRKQRQLDRGFE